MDNATLAKHLMRFADRLDAAGANLYRRRGYRRAAEVILDAEPSVERTWLDKGPDGLRAVPGLGARMARVLDRFFKTGELPLPRAVNRTEAKAVHKTAEES